jgi:hypothetical protein
MPGPHRPALRSRWTGLGRAHRPGSFIQGGDVGHYRARDRRRSHSNHQLHLGIASENGARRCILFRNGARLHPFKGCTALHPFQKRCTTKHRLKWKRCTPASKRVHRTAKNPAPPCTRTLRTRGTLMTHSQAQGYNVRARRNRG